MIGDPQGRHNPAAWTNKEGPKSDNIQVDVFVCPSIQYNWDQLCTISITIFGWTWQVLYEVDVSDLVRPAAHPRIGPHSCWPLKLSHPPILIDQWPATPASRWQPCCFSTMTWETWLYSLHQVLYSGWWRVWWTLHRDLVGEAHQGAELVHPLGFKASRILCLAKRSVKFQAAVRIAVTVFSIDALGCFLSLAYTADTWHEHIHQHMI